MSEKEASDTTLWKGAILPASVIAILLIIIMSVINGGSGLLGALLASITVIIFFSIHLLVARVSRNLDPMATMALAMFSYFAKFMLLGAFLWALTKYTSRETIDRTSFGVSAIALTFAWLGGEIASYLKLKTHLPLPHEQRTN